MTDLAGRFGAAHRKDIDGLRAVAVIPVVLFHAGLPGLSGGFVGVDIFFVISGFLITGIIARELRSESFHIVSFYERRIRRIFPAMFAVFTATSVAALCLLLPPHLRDFGESLWSATLFASNLHFAGQGGYFDGPADFKPLLHTWSLAVEEQFYIFFPVYLWLVFKTVTRQAYVAVATGVILLTSLALSTWSATHHPKAAYYLLPVRADELLLGALLALDAFPKVERPGVRHGLSVLGLLLILWALIGFSNETPFPSWRAMVPCVGAALIIHSGSSGSSLVSRLLGWKPLLFFGWISYSLYLWHWPFLVYGHYYAVRELALPELLGLLVLIVLVSTLSWRFVEAPFRRHGAVFGRPALFAVAAAGMSLLVACGLSLSRSEALPARLPWTRDEFAQISRQNSVDCIKHAGSDSSLCVIGNAESQEPTFALWGDSHAEALSPAMSLAATRRRASGLLFGVMACPPIRGVRKSAVGLATADNAACAAHNDSVFAAILAHPSVSDVLLAGRWPLYESGYGYGADKGLSVKLHDPSDDHILTADEVADALARTIAALIAAGRTVHLLEAAPEFTVGGWDGVARTLLYDRDESVLDEPRTAVDARSSLIARVAKRFESETKFRVIATHDLFCNQRRCSFRSERGPLYFDNNHVGHLATELLTSRLNGVLR